MGDADENSRKVTPPRPQPEPGVAFFLPQLIERLAAPNAGARRVAVLDLLRASPSREHARTVSDALVTALQQEHDPSTRVAMARALSRFGFPSHQPLLAKLRDDPATPIELYHACILAHDQIQNRPPSEGGGHSASDPG